MKKLSLLCISLVIGMNSYSQQETADEYYNRIVNGQNSQKSTANKTTYTGGEMTYQDYYGKKPYGNNVTVVYDSFFKSYQVTYNNSEGIRYKITFEYAGETTTKTDLVSYAGRNWNPYIINFGDTNISISFSSGFNKLSQVYYTISGLTKVNSKKK